MTLSIFIIFISVVGGCVLIYAFASLLGVPVGITSSSAELQICALVTGIKMCKWIIKKKEKSMEYLKLNTIEVLISKALIDSYINHDEFVSVNNVLWEFNEMKKEIKNPETSVDYTNNDGWSKQKNVWKKWRRSNNT